MTEQPDHPTGASARSCPRGAGPDSADGVLVSVVCVTRNRRDLLLRCLESVASQRAVKTELVLVDNDSDDGTEAAVLGAFPQLRYIRLHKNIGFFPALNIAIANASGRYIFTIDDDAYFKTPNDLEHLLAAMNDSLVDVVTCNIEGPRELPPEANNRYVHSFKTGFSLIRTEVLKSSIGYYPDLFFRSAGEAYLASKVWDLGRRVIQVSDVTIFHDQALQGRSVYDWNYYGHKSQIMLVFMRNSLVTILPRLASKFIKGLASSLDRGVPLSRWFSAWVGAFYSLPLALQYRDPIALATERLLRKLSTERICTEESLIRAQEAVGMKTAQRAGIDHRDLELV